MGKFMRTLRQLESLLYHENFIDERILKQEIEEWQKFRTEIREKYLWGHNGNNKFVESRK